MMDGLVADVVGDAFKVGVADGEGAVARLPCEAVDAEASRDEGRRDDLQLAYQIAHCQSRSQADEQVDVIVDAPDRQRQTIAIAAQAVEEPVDAACAWKIEDAASLFRRPHQMNMEPGVDSAHLPLSEAVARVVLSHGDASTCNLAKRGDRLW